MLCLQCNSNINVFPLQNGDGTYSKGQECADAPAINSVRGSYLCLNYSSNLMRSQRETYKHLWPPRCLSETIAGILSSYCISVVKTRNDNFHACICSTLVVAYVSFDRSLLQTLHWSQSILTTTHLTVQWICLLRHPSALIYRPCARIYCFSLCTT